MIAHLLELGVDINGLKPTISGRTLVTPLYHAMLLSNLEAARFLLEHGSDPHRKSSTGRSLLEDAQLNQKTQFVDLIQEFLPSGSVESDSSISTEVQTLRTLAFTRRI